MPVGVGEEGADGGTGAGAGGAGAEGEGAAAAEAAANKPPIEQSQQQQLVPPQTVAPLKTDEKAVGSDSGDQDDLEDDEILEESPCKRWSKRREKVKQRDVPGIDAAYLAMDNETGNEVVWNEVLFSERKNFREQEEKIRAVFDNLIRLEHPNLVKFHKYWMDTKPDKPRIIFITEYMSSGSMYRFLQNARKGNSSCSLLNIKAWKNWTRQILLALSYLHRCDPPIVHANLTCNTVFIQQNGLVKIGCVAPKIIHHHVKTFRENIKNVHYLAPEFDHQTEATTHADIYSFGICALEMATTGALQSGTLNGAGTTSSSASTGALPQLAEAAAAVPATAASTSTCTTGSHMVTEEVLHKAVESLDDQEQKEFIQRCLENDPAKRADVAELLQRLGPPEPDKHDMTSMDERDMEFEEQHNREVEAAQHPPSGAEQRATSPQDAPSIAAQPAAEGVQSSVSVQQPQSQSSAAPAASATIAQQPQTQHQDGYPSTQHQFSVSATATTTSTAAACDTASSTANLVSTASIAAATAAAATTATGGTLLMSVQSQPHLHVAAADSSALDEGYHTNVSNIDGQSGGGVENGPLLLVDAVNRTAPPALPQHHREMRQVVQMHAEVDSESHCLLVKLQLDDQMHRQLKTQLREEDTPEGLSAELVQHGFVCETNSAEMCELLVNVLNEFRRHELEEAVRTEFSSDSTRKSVAKSDSCSASQSPQRLQSPQHRPAASTNQVAANRPS